MDLRSLSSPLRLPPCLFLALVAHTAFGQSTVPVSMADSVLHPRHGTVSPRPLEVEYTGALFGYYRIEPNREPILGGTTKSLPAVEQFLLERKGDNRLLLGMGDNFAPEFGAAIQLEGINTVIGKDCWQPAEEYRPDDYRRDKAPAVLYKDNARIANKAHCDNVTNFLMRAGYRAVVPGREDFLYSADWLQAMARKLKEDYGKDHNPNAENKLNLLAANLRVEGNKGKTCPLLFAKETQKPPGNQTTAASPIGQETQCVASEGEKVPEALDWVERLDATLKANEDNGETNEVTDGMRTAASKSPYVRRQLLINQMSMTLTALAEDIAKLNPKIVNLAAALKDLKDLSSTDGYIVKDNKVISRVDLKSVEVLATLLGNSAGDRKTALDGLNTLFAQLPTVKSDKPGPQEDMKFVFGRDVRSAERNLLLRAIAEEQKDNGYVFSDYCVNGKLIERTLLIGVVGRETMGAVAPGNLQLGDFTTKDSKAVTVLDPRRTVEIVLRAANLAASDEGHPIDRTIVMAQMPHTEAEELGAHLRVSLKDAKVDLILSEAQEEHASAELNVDYANSDMIPVLTPHPAFSRAKSRLVDPISVADIRAFDRRNRLENRPRTADMPSKGSKSTLALLKEQLKLPTEAGSSLTESNAITLILSELQRSSHADVVFLERRDLFLDKIPEEYANYDDICPEPRSPLLSERSPVLLLKTDGPGRCKLHVALDRILWKGDFSQRVMVTGKDLKDALKAAGDQAIAQRSLAARDTRDQWLVTFGVVTSDQTNLTRLESSSDEFAVPWSDACRGDKNSKDPQYCVNGTVVSDDAGYWVATSDHIANDPAIYTMLEPKLANYHQEKTVNLVLRHPDSSGKTNSKQGLFMTDELTKTWSEQRPEQTSDFVEEAATRTAQSTSLQGLQQDRSLLHLDYAKLVAGFNIRHPDGGNSAASGFQGVTETRASQPTQQELDLESVSRFSSDVPTSVPFSLGVQSDAEYDRSVLGNLTNKPINASYSVNSLSVGGFIQKRFPFWGDAKTTRGNWASRELPRTMLVLTPYQYQRQITGNYVFLNFTTGSNELTIHTPVVTGHAYKAGVRHEMISGRKWAFDRGSYWETGWEYVVQDNVAKSLTLTTASNNTSKTCTAVEKQTLSECFTGFTIDSTTKAAPPVLVSQTTTGLYWDFHFQRSLPKGGDSTNAKANVTVDTKGDFFGGRKSSLSTQTRYAFPVPYLESCAPAFR